MRNTVLPGQDTGLPQPPTQVTVLSAGAVAQIPRSIYEEART